MNLREYNSSLCLQVRYLRALYTQVSKLLLLLCVSLLFLPSRTLNPKTPKLFKVQTLIGEIKIFFKEFGFGYPTACTDNKFHPTLFSIVKGTLST